MSVRTALGWPLLTWRPSRVDTVPACGRATDIPVTGELDGRTELPPTFAERCGHWQQVLDTSLTLDCRPA